ncbi:MAG: hypothetical protein MZV70_03555 [Desulfobacterales bacterium]|nr:hypothetical protein [Desulfobacterales bacterium]
MDNASPDTSGHRVELGFDYTRDDPKFVDITGTARPNRRRPVRLIRSQASSTVYRRGDEPDAGQTGACEARSRHGSLVDSPPQVLGAGTCGVVTKYAAAGSGRYRDGRECRRSVYVRRHGETVSDTRRIHTPHPTRGRDERVATVIGHPDTQRTMTGYFADQPESARRAHVAMQKAGTLTDISINFNRNTAPSDNIQVVRRRYAGTRALRTSLLRYPTYRYDAGHRPTAEAAVTAPSRAS